MTRSPIFIALVLFILGFATSPAMAQASINLSARTDAAALPAGTTAQRPTPINGMIRYNSTIAGLEAYVNGSWSALTGPPTVQFNSLTGQPTSTLVYSATIIVTGFAGTPAISISGSGSPAYSIGGAAFTSSSGTITSGQTLQLQLTSPATGNTTYTATVTIGSTTTTWSVTTATQIVIYESGGGVSGVTGDFGAAGGGGRGGVDAYCQSVQPGGLTCNATVRALISVNAAGDSIANMPTNYGIPSGIPLYWYNRTTGTAVALLGNNWADMLDGTISNSMQSGTGVNHNWWSGSSSTGTAAALLCTNWSSTATNGEIGSPTSTSGSWIDSGNLGCGNAPRVLCLCVQD